MAIGKGWMYCWIAKKQNKKKIIIVGVIKAMLMAARVHHTGSKTHLLCVFFLCLLSNYI